MYIKYIHIYISNSAHAYKSYVTKYRRENMNIGH